MIAMSLLAAAEEHVDETQSHSWIFPEGYELLFGSIASIIIFALLWWKAGPLIVKAMRGRTERSEIVTSWLVHGDARDGEHYDRERLTWLWTVTTRQDKSIIEANAAGESAREQVRVAKMTDDVRAMLALAVDVCHNARLQAHHFQRDRRRRQSRGVNERPSRYGHLISREKGEWSGAVRLVEMNDRTSIC